MCLEPPVRRAVHSGRCKCREAKFILTRCNILYYFLKAVKIRDIICSVSRLFQKRLIVNDAVALNYIGDTGHLITIHQGKAVVCQFSCNIGAGQIIAIVLPAGQPYRSIDLEQCGRICLCHF